MNGVTFDEQGARRIVAATKRVERMSTDLVGETKPPRSSPQAGTTQLIITAVDIDYLACARINPNGEAVVGSEVLVARPFKLRADASYFPEVDSITIGSPNRVIASGSGGDDEVWEVRPYGYEIDDIITAARATYTGVTVAGAVVPWIDLNVDARAWSVVDEDTEIEA